MFLVVIFVVSCDFVMRYDYQAPFPGYVVVLGCYFRAVCGSCCFSCLSMVCLCCSGCSGLLYVCTCVVMFVCVSEYVVYYM